MTGWHAPDDLITRYTDGSLPETDAWSLEKHLEGCTPCAVRASRAARAGAAGTVLAEVRDAVLHAAGPRSAPVPAGTAPGTPPPAPAPVDTTPGRVRTAGGRLGHIRTAGGRLTPARTAGRRLAQTRTAGGRRTPARTAGRRLAQTRTAGARIGRVLWAAGPALRGAWAGAVVLVAVGALALAYGGGFDGARPLLLAVAPVVPVAGVALSYGRHADPLHEIAAASPSGGLRLVLTRTAAVLAVSLPLLTAAGLLLPAGGPRLPQAPSAAAWLLPGLALTLATLALSGYVGCRAASAVVGAGWLLALAGPVLADTGAGLTARLTEQLSLYFTGAPPQWAWAAGAALCALLLAARRTAYDRLETM
ncbi:zf-HC2 domain-containing protein [Streptomyces sp. NPDC005551]|uniref:zf-HC2 domain-containing protein n=1 Tax=Streptomyces sp. NPDC005551 TaxID=3364725 RepID=UPI00368B8EA8